MTLAEVRAFAITLPPSSEVLVRVCVKFRIGRIVYLAMRGIPRHALRHHKRPGVLDELAHLGRVDGGETDVTQW